MSVFVVQKPKPGPRQFTYDISPCLQFGQPVYVFEAADQPGLSPDPSMRRARAVLQDFNPASDYILWAGGDPFGLAIVSAVLAEDFGNIPFLRWERERDAGGNRNGRGFYVPVKLELRRKVTRG